MADAAINPASRPPSSGWRFFLGLAPAIIFWAVLVGWLAYALSERSQFSQRADEANLVEWLDEARVFRKSLPELVREYLTRHENGQASEGEPEDRAEEILEQLRALLCGWR